MRSWLRPLLALAFGAGLDGAGAARAELVRLEALGAVPARERAPAGTSLRQAAVQAALEEAVLRSALALVAGGDSPEQRVRVARILGDDPFVYTARYRLLEDHGERPRLLVSDPQAEWEHVVRVEAQVELDRVRARLAEAGLLAGHRTVGVRVAVEGVDSWSRYRSVHDALARGTRAVRPLEFGRGRVVFEVETERDAAVLLEALRSGLPRELRVVPLALGGLGLRVRLDGPGGDGRAASPRSGPSS